MGLKAICVIHQDGWAISNDCRTEAKREKKPDGQLRLIKSTVFAVGVFNHTGVIKEGCKVDILMDYGDKKIAYNGRIDKVQLDFIEIDVFKKIDYTKTKRRIEKWQTKSQQG